MAFIDDHLQIRKSTTSFEFSSPNYVEEVDEENTQTYDVVSDGDGNTYLSQSSNISYVATPTGSSKDGRKRQRKGDDITNKASMALDNIANVMSSQFGKPENIESEEQVFGKYIALRIEKIEDVVRKTVLKNKIENLIFQAEMEELEEKK